jgi:hypothetical protein
MADDTSHDDRSNRATSSSDGEGNSVQETTGEATADVTAEAELTAGDDGLATRQEFQMRFALAQALGENLPGGAVDDYYEVFSWDKNPSVEDFYALALRNPFAYAVTFLPSETTWRDPPRINDAREQEDGTAFENDVSDLVEENKLWHYCRRADKLAGIGKFGILVLQLDDIDGPDGLSDPVSNVTELQGLRPFSRASVSDLNVGAPGTDRWGDPTQYQLDFSDENETESAIQQEGPEEVWVHWQRVIHVPSDELLDDELRGVERQRPVYNNLIDVEKALGAAGQLAYRAAAWGININIDKEFDLEDNGEQLQEHLQRWQHGLENVLRTHGADEVQSLGGEDIDPSLITDPNIEAISAQTGIPQSVLKGNETGERATTQDLKEWYGKISERRSGFIEQQLVRALIDRLREFDLIDDPSGADYTVDWPPLAETSEEDMASIQTDRATVLDTWPFATDLLTPEQQREFVETGDLPTELDLADVPELDDPEGQVEAQFEQTSQTPALADGGQVDEVTDE